MWFEQKIDSVIEALKETNSKLDGVGEVTEQSANEGTLESLYWTAKEMWIRETWT